MVYGLSRGFHVSMQWRVSQKRDNVEDYVDVYVDVYLKKATYLRTYSNNIYAIPDDNLWPIGNFETVLP